MVKAASMRGVWFGGSGSTSGRMKFGANLYGKLGSSWFK
jgi:hypothetical protein